MSFESMLIETCDIQRAQAAVSTATGRQKRIFATIASDVPCLMQTGGAQSNREDIGFVQRGEWRVFVESGQDVQDGDRVVSATRGFTGEVHSSPNIITPSHEDGHHLELSVRQLVHEGP